MTDLRRLAIGVRLAGVCAALALAVSGLALQARSPQLPARLSDADFWALSQDLSEPNGNFQSDNLVSNETGFQYVIPQLVERLGTGGVYMGVGPEQNFTYIAALKPRIAFIVDVRRGNRDLHLMYKALFEMAADRAEFISLLFSRPRPSDVSKDASARELFAAFENVAPSEADYRRTLYRINETLLKTHRLPLSDEELDGIEYVFYNFFKFGPGLGYTSSRTGRGNLGATYASLMTATDGPTGVERSYLASEANFNVMKSLEAANLLVPAVGNFSGPKAVRAVGTWLREHGAVVSAYYLSNVEDYLSRGGTWLDFCRNAATLPQDDKSTFIRTGTGYRPANAPSAAPMVIPQDQINRLMAQGGGTITLSNGARLMVNPGGVTGITSTGGMGSSRLGVMHDDLAPCAVPKLIPFH